MDALLLRRKMMAGSGIKLPDGYRRVEYVELTSETRRIQLYFTSVSADIVFQIEAMDKGSANNAYLLLCDSNPGKNIQVAYNQWTSHGVPSYVGNSKVKSKLVLHKTTGNEWTLTNGSDTSTKTSGSSTRNPAYLFGRLLDDGDSQFIGYVWSVKVYEDGVLIYDLVPCQRIEDDVYRFYDVVSKAIL